MSSIDSPTASGGHLVATVGGLLGGVALGAAAGAVGAAIALALEDPDAGLSNLGLLLYPLGLGALGILVGVALGVLLALRRGDHRHAARTAWVTLPLTMACLVLVPAAGLGAVLVLGAPAAARWAVLHLDATSPREAGGVRSVAARSGRHPGAAAPDRAD